MIILQDELNNSTLLKKESVSQIKVIETIQLKLEQKKRMGEGEGTELNEMCDSMKFSSICVNEKKNGSEKIFAIMDKMSKIDEYNK